MHFHFFLLLFFFLVWWDPSIGRRWHISSGSRSGTAKLELLWRRQFQLGMRKPKVPKLYSAANTAEDCSDKCPKNGSRCPCRNKETIRNTTKNGSRCPLQKQRNQSQHNKEWQPLPTTETKKPAATHTQKEWQPLPLQKQRNQSQHNKEWWWEIYNRHNLDALRWIWIHFVFTSLLLVCFLPVCCPQSQLATSQPKRSATAITTCHQSTQTLKNALYPGAVAARQLDGRTNDSYTPPPPHPTPHHTHTHTHTDRTPSG